jgi:NTP pyrophosphatase (non-canonical NTP hydrolase)
MIREEGISFEEFLGNINRTWRYYPLELDNSEALDKAIDNAFKGCVGELGEISELLKKKDHHGIEYSAEKMNKELGDFLFYAVKLTDLLRDTYSLSDVVRQNIEKLKARYPEGFVEGGGIR